MFVGRARGTIEVEISWTTKLTKIKHHKHFLSRATTVSEKIFWPVFPRCISLHSFSCMVCWNYLVQVLNFSILPADHERPKKVQRKMPESQMITIDCHIHVCVKYIRVDEGSNSNGLWAGFGPWVATWEGLSDLVKHKLLMKSNVSMNHI